MKTLTPAYGRDYKNKKAVLADWQADKDFIIADFSASKIESLAGDVKLTDFDSKIHISEVI